MKTKEEIEQLAESQYGTEIGSIRGSNPYDLEADRKNGFIKGYIQCQEDVVNEKLDEDDIKEMALDYIINTGGLPKNIEEWQNALWKFYESLNKQD